MEGGARAVVQAVLHELTFERTLDFPPEVVFSAWTDPVHVARWWGPKDFTNPVCEWDARVGGRIRVDMTSPQGVVFTTKGEFYEISPPSKLVFKTTAFDDDAGIPRFEVMTTADFAGAGGGRTRLRVTAQVIRTAPDLERAMSGMNRGWNESLDRLEAALGSEV
jgi:uncharacterized protein YndB with AHSA1/START domain